MRHDQHPPARAGSSRRQALQRLWALAAAQATASVLAGCGGGGSSPQQAGTPPPPPSPPPAPTSSPLSRLKTALQRAPLSVAATSVTVSQGNAQSAQSSLGVDAVLYPPLVNPNRESLASVAQVWGYRRDLWTRQSGAVIAGNAVFPVSRDHPSATAGSAGVCGLHFVFDGRAFEILFAGTDVQITLLADGMYVAAKIIRSTLSGGLAGAPLSTPNTFVRLDFGRPARRQISIYARSSQGPCAIAIGATDRLQAWDRSAEAAFGGMTDSYGGAFGPNWGVSGPFWEAAALLGIPHVDLDTLGGTGYAPNNTNPDTRRPGNAYRARLPSNVDAQPDLFITAGGINDNNSQAAPPLYATAAEALATFNAGVAGYYQDLRAALPGSVLVATGPWKPRATRPTDPVEQSKADTIKAALQAVGGPWVFLDNLNGGWVNSAGASVLPTASAGPWQTGTGNSAAPAGDGNGDLYLAADGVHPNEAGCLYLGTRLATDLRAALLAL